MTVNPLTMSAADLQGGIHDGSVATLEDAIDHYQSGGPTIRAGAFAGVGAESPFNSGFVKSFGLDPSLLNDPRLSNPWPKAAFSDRSHRE